MPPHEIIVLSLLADDRITALVDDRVELVNLSQRSLLPAIIVDVHSSGGQLTLTAARAGAVGFIIDCIAKTRSEAIQLADIAENALALFGPSIAGREVRFLAQSLDLMDRGLDGDFWRKREAFKMYN